MDDIARIDQEAKSHAKALGSFRRELIAEGFERPEALELCRDWFEQMLVIPVEEED